MSNLLSALHTLCLFLQHNSNAKIYIIPLFKIAVVAVPLERFYPFGASSGDATIGPTDDSGSSLVVLMQNFSFFNISYADLFVSD